MKSKKIPFGLIGLVLAAAVAGFWFLGADDSGSPEEWEVRGKTSFTPKPGDLLVYGVKMASIVTFGGAAAGMSPGGGAPQNLSVNVEGRLTVRVVESGPGHTLAKIAMDGPRLSLGQGGQATPSGAMATTEASLSDGLFVRLQPNGLIANFVEADLGDPFAGQILKQVAAFLQVSTTIPAEGVRELDGTGTYSATYTKSGDGFVKVKDGYAQMSGTMQSAGNVGLRGEVKGRFEGKVQEDGWLQSLKGKEEAAVYVGRNEKPYSTSASTIEIKYFKRQKLPAGERERLAMAADSAANRPTNGVSSRIDEEKVALQQLGGLTLDDVLQLREDVESLPPSERGRAEHEAFMKTKAWIQLHQKDLGALRQSFEGRSATDPWVKTALSALAFEGCDECQDLVIDAVEARLEEGPDVVPLIPFLADSPLPSEKSESALRRLAESNDNAVAHSAKLALGVVANRLQTAAPERADRIVGDAVDRLGSATDPDTRREALAVLGNAGSAKALGPLRPYLDSEDEGVRIDAVFATRLIKTDEARQVALDRISDPSAKVRTAAVDALGYQGVTTVVAGRLASRLSKEEDPRLRQLIIQKLQDAYGDLPAAREAVDAAAQSDPDERVRAAAEQVRIANQAN